jgi:hypothetical protein
MSDFLTEKQNSGIVLPGCSHYNEIIEGNQWEKDGFLQIFIKELRK